MHTRRILIGALAAPALLLSACGGDDSVADPPVSSAPTSSAPTDPPPQETPQHFIARWADVEKRMENTGETSDYLRLSKACVACRSLVKDVRKFYAAGGFIHWGGLHVLSVKRHGTQPDGSVAYEVRTDSTPTQYKESSSAAVKTLKGGETSELVSLKRSHGSYVVVARARLSQ